MSLNYNLDKAAYHGAEIPYFWQDDFELSGDAERQLAAEVALYLRNFAHSGDPNVAPPTAPGLPEPPVVWPRYSAGSGWALLDVGGSGAGGDNGTIGIRTVAGQAWKHAECAVFDAMAAGNATKY